MTPKRIWFLETGVCPYGHPTVECTKMRTNYHGRPQPVCTINEREAKRKRDKRLRDERNAAYRVVIIPFKAPPAPAPKLVMGRLEGTSEHSGRQHTAGVQCVKGHWNFYPRTFDHYTVDPGPLWCRRCGDFQEVHQVSALEAGTPGLLYWPLEADKVVPVKHIKNAGSGRA